MTCLIWNRNIRASAAPSRAPARRRPPPPIIARHYPSSIKPLSSIMINVTERDPTRRKQKSYLLRVVIRHSRRVVDALRAVCRAPATSLQTAPRLRCVTFIYLAPCFYASLLGTRLHQNSLTVLRLDQTNVQVMTQIDVVNSEETK